MKISFRIINNTFLGIIFLIGCNKTNSTEPLEAKITNPIVISFSSEREAETQKVLNDFLSKYNALNKLKHVKRDSTTSYLTEISFEEGVKVFNKNNISAKDPETRLMFIEFFKTCEKLFGTNLRVSESASQGMVYALDYLYFTIFQNELNSKIVEFANSPRVLFQCRQDGTLLKIESSLIPEFMLPPAMAADSVKIMQNILNKNITLNLDNPARQLYFDKSYTYSISKLNSVYLEKLAEKYLLYSLTTVRATKLLYEGHPGVYDIYCHPNTNEVILAKSYPVF